MATETEVLAPPSKIYYHSTTDNKSFLRMYKFLRERGVVNNKFFLALYDKDLMDVKPLELVEPDGYIKAKIIRECAINPWYFLREIVRFKVPGGISRYELSRGNLAVAYCLLNNLNVTHMMPRQRGKTLSTIGLFDWLFRFGTTNSEMLFVNKKQDDASKNLQRFSDTDQLLPSWLKDKRSNVDKDNTEVFSRESTGNFISTLPGANSQDAADKLGRGLSVPNLWCDEFAFLAFNSIFYKAASLTLSKAAEEAEKRNKPHFKLITTTPNSVDLPEGQFCKMMMDMADTFDELVHYDIPLNELSKYIEDHSENSFIHIEYSWRALGLSESWYKRQCRDLNNDRLAIKREVDLEWTLSSDRSPFSEEELELVSSFMVEEDSILKFNTGYKGFKLLLLDPPDFYKTVSLACDCSGGLGLDKSVMLVIENETGKVIGGFYSNRINTSDFRELIFTVATRVFLNSTIIIERNSYGLNIITDLLGREETRKRLFYHYKDEEKAARNKALIDDLNARVYGVDTGPKSREVMIDILFRKVSDGPELFRFPIIIKELKTLERKKTGKIEHTSGEHDDSVMAFLIFQYASTLSTFKRFINKVLVRPKKLSFLDDYDSGRIIHETLSLERRIDASKNTNGYKCAASRIFNANK
jgi:hypothetical protein